MHRWIAIGLLLCGMAAAHPAAAQSKSWRELRAKNLRIGLSEERVDRAMAACRAADLPLAEAETLFGPVFAAHDEKLSADCVLLRIEEGLAKHVGWAEVQQAADRRLQGMRQADRLIMAARSRRGGQHDHLMMHTCMAIESGLPIEVFEHLFSRPGGFRYGRMIHVVEAGEALTLAGLADGQTLLLMNDFLDRDLAGFEIFRVVDLVRAGLRDGKDFETIHATLWAAGEP
ncbi:hypothetical protein [Pontiella sp.]|uniref:hypothetical protein n=1 Tax=Pontiella sp. TaxID=2837462 RepID=UPI00356B421C